MLKFSELGLLEIRWLKLREVKKHDDRKNEILDVAEKLFYTKGFELCTINDILKEVGIAKGTFYHYFNSKEETLDAIVDRNIQNIISKVKNAINREGLNPVEKLMNAFLAMRMDSQKNEDNLKNLHRIENSLYHQKNLSRLILAMSPILVEIIEEGIDRKVWSCKYPLEYMKIFMAAAFTLTDEGIFNDDSDSNETIMIALVSILEKLLEMPDGLFVKLFIENWV